MLLVAAFVLLYEATVSDSRYAARQAELLTGALRPIPGTRLQFKATAYCKGHTTASGVAARSGVAAADPRCCPWVGHPGRFRAAPVRRRLHDYGYRPGGAGREIDVYMWSCFEALRFGRQDVHLVVLRLGWSPKDTTPLIETLFPRRIPYGNPDEASQEAPRTPRTSRMPPAPIAPIPNPTFKPEEPASEEKP